MEPVVNEPLDAVFTSENYGDGFARDLNLYFASNNKSANVCHVLVDIDRRNFPISGTVLRKDIHKYRHFLSSEVYRSFVRRICFIGAESTGKSTLAELMAKECETVFVPEYGRTLWEQQDGKLSYDDLLRIAKKHVANEDEMVHGANHYLFVDTTPLTCTNQDLL